MTLLLIHFALLAWLSHASASRLVSNAVDRILAAAMLFWGNIVLNSLVLSQLGKFGEAAWFFRTSLLLAVLTWGALWRWMKPPVELTPVSSAEPRNGWLVFAFFATLIPILLANLRMAWIYPPNNYDSLAYHLPRVMYYLGHNTLAQFESADIRHVYFTFNYNLLQAACFVYDAPDQSINFLNVASWVVTGLGLYRVTRLSGASFNASLISTWLALTATGVLAQATATTLDLPTVAALLASFAFAMRWRVQPRAADAWLAGLAAGLAAGAKLTVVFFGPAVVALIAIFAFQAWRRGQFRGFMVDVRAWILPAVVAIVISVPFIVYNLAATGQWMTKELDFTLNKPFSFAGALQTSKAYLFQLFFEPTGRFSYDLDLIRRLNEWYSWVFFKDWNEAHAYSGFYVIPPDLNEDHVWYGFAGPLLLVCAVVCLWRDRRLVGPTAWFALLGLGWFITYFAMNKWSLYIQRYFLPALVILAPCVAAVWDGRAGGARWLTGLKRWVFIGVASTSLWFAISYLDQNRNRPFTLPGSDFVAPKILPDVPVLLHERLAEQSKINVMSDAANERIYLLMNLGRKQRFTSSRTVDPQAYNLFSYWGFTRNNIYNNIAYFASYTIVGVPTKPTAGVEFLGTVGEGVNAFDYAGMPPHAADIPSRPENRNIAVLAYYNRTEPNRFVGSRLRVDGLNPTDGARVEISAELEDGTRQPLLAQTHSGEVTVSIVKPFKRLVIEVVDVATGRRIGLGDLPHTTKPTASDLPEPLSDTTLFRTELIAPGTARNLSVNGLADLEGPYSEWQLPVFRWSKQPSVRIEVPDNPKLTRLEVTFNVRLQMRDKADLQLLHNGKVMQEFALEGRKKWTRETVTLIPAKGDNLIELRDNPRFEVPDWLAYLEDNPDVKAYVESTGADPEKGARDHYEKSGRYETRPPLKMKPSPGGAEPPPDSLYFLYRSLQIEGFTDK